MKLSKQLHILAASILMASHLIFSMAFFLAYSTPEKAITITIDEYNEANIELIVLIFSLIIMPFFIIPYFKFLLKKEDYTALDSKKATSLYAEKE